MIDDFFDSSNSTNGLSNSDIVGMTVGVIGAVGFVAGVGICLCYRYNLVNTDFDYRAFDNPYHSPFMR